LQDHLCIQTLINC